VKLAAPPGSDWCGDKKRSQGGEKEKLSSGVSTACRQNYGEGNMSGLPSEPLRKGGPKCPYFPYCEAPHGALQCVRLALVAKEHRKVCLHCREQEVDADGACGQCRSPRAPASEPRPSVAPWPRPDWTVVPEAITDQDFYECIALSGVARFNHGPNRATVKDFPSYLTINKTMLYKEWLGDIDVELLPTEPRTVTPPPPPHING
jgi:hypothetical protein